MQDQHPTERKVYGTKQNDSYLRVICCFDLAGKSCASFFSCRATLRSAPRAAQANTRAAKNRKEREATGCSRGKITSGPTERGLPGCCRASVFDRCATLGSRGANTGVAGRRCAYASPLHAGSLRSGRREKAVLLGRRRNLGRCRRRRQGLPQVNGSNQRWGQGACPVVEVLASLTHEAITRGCDLAYQKGVS